MATNKIKESRDILLNSIAKIRGYEFDPTIGLIELETGQHFTEDPNIIAKTLLGQMTTDKDLTTVESVLSVITKLYNYEKLVEAARPELLEQGINLPEASTVESHQTGTVDWFKRMMQVCQ